jgi:hypothetical protein
MSCDDAPSQVPANFHLGDMAGFLYYDEILGVLDEMASRYPQLISVRRPVSDTLFTIEGREVFWVKISDNPDLDEDEPEVLYTALTHAREPASAMSMLYYMWHLLEQYNSNQEVRRIVNNTELYFIPVVNPDGYIYNESTSPQGGGMWRKNLRDNDQSGTIDQNDGVDLNRNYGYLWGYDDTGSSPKPHLSTYRGTGPFSEPEVQMIRDFVFEHNFSVAMHDHSYGDDLYHAWGHGDSPLPDADILYRLSDLMSWYNRYLFGQLHDTYWLGTVNGGANDWFYGEQDAKAKIYSWVPEIGPVFWPDPLEILPICEKQLHTHLMAARIAGQYAIIHDLNPTTLHHVQNTLLFRIENMGLVSDDMHINIVPAGKGISQVNVRSEGLITFDEILETELVTVDMLIDPRVSESNIIDFDVVITTDQGEITRLRVQKQLLGVEYEIPYQAWESETWDTCSVVTLPGMVCLSDSPQGLQPEDRTSMSLVAPLNLEDIVWARISFMAKWSIETNKDFVQFQVRAGGGDWMPVCGKYSKGGAPGSQLKIPSPFATQPMGEPVYDGRSEWVREEVDLTPWVGIDSLELRFFTWSGKSLSRNQGDGFYVADVRLHQSRRLHCSDNIQNADEEEVDCGGIDCGPCPTCADGILNGGEEEVDCGGTDCIPCPTCKDGLMNGDETGVDCGGPSCSECIPTCDDGIQNGDEAGIDCGGADCPLPCKTRCCDRDNRISNGADFGIGLAPNPTSHRLVLSVDPTIYRLTDLDFTPLQYEIFDVVGRPFGSGVLTEVQSVGIDVGGLPDQMYVIRISDAEGRAQILRFVKTGGS